MNSGNPWFTEPDRSAPPVDPPPVPNPGTPLYDELAAVHTITAAIGTQVPAPGPSGPSTDSDAPCLALSTAVLEVFTRLKRVEAGDGGWGGGDAVDVMTRWFTGFGIDVEADEVAAARSLRMPAWLACALTAPRADDHGLIIHVRTDNPSPVDSVHPYLVALIQGLGAQTSAAVFDIGGDQIAHLVH